MVSGPGSKVSRWTAQDLPDCVSDRSGPVYRLGLQQHVPGDEAFGETLSQHRLAGRLRWNLFDRFDRELTVTEREANLEVIEAEAGDARREVSAELTARLADLEASRAQIAITGTSVVAAREDLRVQQERYRLGASTIVDVLSSQEALNQAEVDVLVARFSYLRSKAQIEALIGRVL